MPILTPSGDRVLAKVIPGETQTTGGVLITERGQSPVSQQAIVLAKGRGRMRKKTGQIIPIPVNVGDRILYRKYGMRELMIDGEFFVMIETPDIMGVIE